MLKVLYFLAITAIPLFASAQKPGNPYPDDPKNPSLTGGHIDSAVTSFKQGKWQQVVAMFDSIVSNNYFTNNQLYYAVSKSLESLSRETPEPTKKDSLMQASKKVYEASLGEWGEQVMESGVDLKVYSIADKNPEPVGGMKNYTTYLEQNMNYPPDALQQKKEGKVFLQFVVNKDGSVDGIKVQRGLCKTCNEEAIRLIKEGPKWTPGKQNGQPVFVRMVLPVSFNIRDYYRALKVKNTN
ncbi:MAG: energy transducer TonB [Imperialibacter sp.]|uniref:energy transducer TonB n=1 Tax=Imperialibacter sp. TaxID=2038411 RepID=UPI0032EB23BA